MSNIKIKKAALTATYGPDFAGLDFRNDESASAGLQKALFANRVGRHLGSCWGPGSRVAGASNLPCIGAFYYRRKGQADRVLFANRNTLLVDGVPAVDVTTGSALNLGGSAASVAFARKGTRVYFVDGIGPLRYWNSADNQVYTVAVPAPPTVKPTLTTNIVTAQVIDTMTSLTGWTSSSTHVPLALQVGPFGNSFIVNSNGAENEDRIYKDTSAAPLDWSGIPKLTVKLYSTGNEKRIGSYLAFYFVDGTTTTVKPLYIEEANKVCNIDIDLSDVLVADRNAITEFGFKVIDGRDIGSSDTSREFVVRFGTLQTAVGISGKFEYTYVWVTKQGTVPNELVLKSRESPSDVISCSGGKSVTVTVPSNPGEVWIYRRKVDVETDFFLHDKIASPTLSYVDTLETSSQIILQESRSGPPSGADSIAIHHLRVVLGKDSDLFIGNTNDPTTSYDIDAEMALEYTFLDSDGMKIEIGEPIVALTTIPMSTGSDLIGNTAIMTATRVIVLQGNSPTTFDISVEKSGGLCSRAAFCKSQEGYLLWADRTGDIWAMDASLERQNLSGAIVDRIKLFTSKDKWVLGLDHVAKRLVLWAWNGLVCETYAYDFVTEGWDDLLPGAAGTSGTVVEALASASTGSGDAAYLVGFDVNGAIQRVFDPAATPPSWDIRTGQIAPGYTCVTESVTGRISGPGTLTLTRDRGTATERVLASSVAIDGLFRVRPLRLEWETLDLELTGESGTLLHEATVLAQVRRRV